MLKLVLILNRPLTQSLHTKSLKFYILYFWLTFLTFPCLLKPLFFRKEVNLQRKKKKAMVLRGKQKGVLEMGLHRGGSTRNINQDPVLFMDLAHLEGHQHQAHLSHLEVMVFMSEVTQAWLLRWGDLENTKECSFQPTKYLCFILT